MAIKIRGITILGYGATDLDSSNIAVGARALVNIVDSAACNTAVGTFAGTSVFNGTNNVVIGYNAQVSDSSASNEIVIGNGQSTRVRIPGLGLDTNSGLSGQVLCWNGSQFVFDSAVASSVVGGIGLDSATVVAIVDSSVAVAINALVDGAPDALNTLNELAEALNDDSAAYDTLINLINGRMSEADTINLIDSAYVQARQDYSYSSLTGTPNVLDSADVTAIVGVAETGLDSATVIELIDSAHIQARQDYSYSSLTGTPNLLDSADVALIVGDTGLDSAAVVELIDSAHVQARQDYSYSSLTGTPNVLDSADVVAIVGVSEVGLDSATVIELIDSAHVQARQDYSYSSLTGTPNVLDSADVAAIVGVSEVGLDSAAVVQLVDSAYVNARVDAVQASGVDSSAIIELVDSAYVQARQDYSYSSLTGTPNILDSASITNLITATVGVDSSFVTSAIDSAIDALIDGAPGALDTLNELAAALNDDSAAYNTLLSQINTKLSSGDIPGIVDSAYIALRVPLSLDSSSVLTVVDSDYVQARQDYSYSSLTGTPNILDSADVISLVGTAETGLDSTAVFDLIDSAYINFRVDAGVSGGGLDSAQTIQLIDSAYVQARQLGADLSSYATENYVNNAIDSSVINGFSVVDNAWNISVAVYDSISFSVLAQEAAPNGVFFKPDGTKMYITGQSGDDVNEYNLSTAWEVSSASYVQNFSVASNATLPSDLFFKPDGTKMYILNAINSTAFEYDLSTAWDISSATYNSVSYSVGTEESTPYGIFFKPDGTKMYITGPGGSDVNEYNLSTAWDISSASYVQNFRGSHGNNPGGVHFSGDGAIMFVLGGGTNITRYDLTTAWDISTATNAVTKSITEEPQPQGLFFKPDGTKLYICGTGNDTVYQYSVGSAPTYLLSQFITSDDALELIDSAYVQARQDYTYSSLTGTPNVLDSADVASIAGSLNGLDSTGVVSLITADYIEARRPAEAIFSVTNNGASAYTFLPSDGFADSSDNPTLYLQRGLTYKFEMNASGHPFEIRLSDGGSAYSSGVTNNAAEVGDVLFTVPMNAPNSLVYQCTVHSGMVGDIVIFDQQSFVDSSDVNSIITLVVDSDYVAARAGGAVGTGGLDSAAVIQLIDSAYVAVREANAGVSGGGLDSSAVIQLIDSAYVAAREADGGGTGGLDSAAVLNLFNTGSYTGVRTFQYTADSGQTVFSGTDDFGATLNYNVANLLVFLNGILLIDSADYTAANGSSINLVEGTSTADLLTAINISAGGLDSIGIISLIDSAYVAAREADAGGGEGGGGIDSANVISLITSTVDSDYVVAREADAGGGTGGLDSAAVIQLIDSAYVAAREADAGGVTTGKSIAMSIVFGG